MNTIILLLIGANILVSVTGFNDDSFFRKNEFNIAGIRSGEFYRMFTSGFLHVDFMHLFANMLTLYFFAPIVYQHFESIWFLIIYMVSLFWGNALTYYFHKNDYYYRAVGASGAVTGILYSAILLQPNMSIGLYFVIPIPAYLFGIGYLFYSIYGMKAQNDNIGHTAHFGGAMAGYLITLIKQPELLYQNTLMVLLLALPILVLFVLIRNNKI